MVKVSIVLPLYNAYEYASICLDSITSQTYDNIEIIAVDDKSTDKSVILLKKYKRMFKHFKLICVKQNSGVSHARNVGIEEATGDYIFFIDSDDFIDKDAIAKAVGIATKYKVDVVDMERLFWYKKRNRLLTFTEQKRLKDNALLGDIYNDKRIITMPRYVTGKLYKREVIGDIRFDETIRCYEDALFNHQIKAKCSNYMYAKDIFYHYLQRPSSLINTASINHIDYVHASREIKNIYDKNKYYNLPIKDIVDDIILDDILVILAIKIPKMEITIKEKKKYVKDFTDLIKELSLSNSHIGKKISFMLFKNDIFQSVYFMLTSHINLIGLGFDFLTLFHPYKVKDDKLKKKVMMLYEKMNN